MFEKINNFFSSKKNSNLIKEISDKYLNNINQLEADISNFFNEKHRFKKDFLKLTNNLFSKLIDNHKYIPLEIEIATFTSWK